MSGRIILLVLLLLVVIGVVAGALLFLQGGDSTDPDATEEAVDGVIDDEDGVVEDAATAQPTQVPGVSVVIALQDLPRGFRLGEEFLTGGSPAVGVVTWPPEFVPQNAFQSVEQLTGLWVRTDIPRESPVLSTQVVEIPTGLGNTGSDAALVAPPGQVLIAVPLDSDGLNSVARGLQPGDVVDVILSFLFVGVDEEFQTRLPNTFSVLTRNEEGEILFSDPREGRLEPSPLSSLGVLIGPTEVQRPRLVTQRTITGAQVIHVGYFPPNGVILGVTATPTAFDTPTQDPAGPTQQQQDQPTATPAFTATPFNPTIVTLAVSPQDAVELTWAIDARMPMTLVTRSANGGDFGPTAPVTLQYLLDTYNVPNPELLPFSLEPNISSIRQVDFDVFQPYERSNFIDNPLAPEGGQ